MKNDTPFENYYSLITARNGSQSVLSNAAELKIASANFWRNKQTGNYISSRGSG
jgi:hypothetical protein